MNRALIRTAGFINLATALIHTAAGQIDLVNPLIDSNLSDQQKAEWIAVWHIVTIVLFTTSFMILKAGFGKGETTNLQGLRVLGLMYVLMSVPFIGSGAYFSVFAPQWVLLLPVGMLLLVGARKRTVV
jgi:hypothetical protein